MWQEDLTAQVGRVLGRMDLVLVSTPAHIDGDWATAVPAGPPHDDDAARRVQELPPVQRARWENDRLVLTLTDAARSQVVTDVLTGHRPARLPLAGRHTPGQRHDPAPALRRAGAGLLLPDLYPVRLAHARTAMLLRQGGDHHVLTDQHASRHAMARLWQDLAPARIQGTEARDLLLALSTSNVARVRARGQDRAAPLVTNLGRIATHFTHWFAATRCTPRGSPPGTDSPIMDTYRLHLALAAATGLTLRAGLTDLGRTAPEYL